MSEADKPFDANAFEKEQKAEKLAALKEDLNTPVTTHEIAGVGETPITRLDIISHAWRRTATNVLQVIDPEGYAAYRRMKYGAKGENKNPEFETRRKAYEFAIRRFLRASYKLANC